MVAYLKFKQCRITLTPTGPPSKSCWLSFAEVEIRRQHKGFKTVTCMHVGFFHPSPPINSSIRNKNRQDFSCDIGRSIHKINYYQFLLFSNNKQFSIRQSHFISTGNQRQSDYISYGSRRKSYFIFFYKSDINIFHFFWELETIRFYFFWDSETIQFPISERQRRSYFISSVSQR